MPISKDYQTVICHTEKVGGKVKSQTRILMTWINDKEEALNTTHTLKGVSGNLGMTRLYKACCNTVELIRADEFEKARESYGELEAAYEETCNLIK